MPDLATWTEPRTPNLAAMHPPLELYIVLFLRDSVMILAVTLMRLCISRPLDTQPLDTQPLGLCLIDFPYRLSLKNWAQLFYGNLYSVIFRVIC